MQQFLFKFLLIALCYELFRLNQNMHDLQHELKTIQSPIFYTRKYTRYGHFDTFNSKTSYMTSQIQMIK